MQLHTRKANFSNCWMRHLLNGSVMQHLHQAKIQYLWHLFTYNCRPTKLWELLAYNNSWQIKPHKHRDNTCN